MTAWTPRVELLWCGECRKAHRHTEGKCDHCASPASALTRIDPRLELERIRTRQWQAEIRETIRELQNAANDLAFALQAHFAYGKRSDA